MCTIHANSAREAVTKLCTLPLLAGENVTHQTVLPGTGSRLSISRRAFGRSVLLSESPLFGVTGVRGPQSPFPNRSACVE